MSGAAKAPARNNGNAQLRSMPRDRELPFRALFEGAAIGLVACTLDGHILETNAAFAKMLGYQRKELVGMHTCDYGRHFQRKDHLARVEAGHADSLKLENLYLRKDGSDFWGELTVSVVHGDIGEPAFLLAVLKTAQRANRSTNRTPVSRL